MASSNGGQKRKGLLDSNGSDTFEKLRKGVSKVLAIDPKGEARQAEVNKLAHENAAEQLRGVVEDKPFVGALPKLLTHPQVASDAETARATEVVCQAVTKLIKAASGVTIILAKDSHASSVCKPLLDAASEEVQNPKTIVSLAADWLQTLPFTQIPGTRRECANRLVIYVGTPGKYLSMCIKSYRGVFDKAYAENRLVVLCKGAAMLPFGTQEQNIFGVCSDKVFSEISHTVREMGSLGWAHEAGSKAVLMQRAFGYPIGGTPPPPLTFEGDAGGSVHSFDYFVEYVKFLNLVKQAQPPLPVTNYYDTGLLISVLMGCVVQAGPSLLTDQDGLAMLRDASIGHIISKLNQVIAVEPYKSRKGVYNFFIGDGACRLNGGVELALHLVEGYKAASMTNLFIFNNHKWAIEDNLVAETEKEHVLYNKDFYDLIQQHGRVCTCENDLELRETIALLSRRTHDYLQGAASPGLSVIVVRGIDVTLPPVIGDISPIIKSPEMAFMRTVLGQFAQGCDHKVPIYGCSAFEYIQYLHIFMETMPEGKKYQYVCGRTDIQAAHMCGFEQPEGKCVLFINDVYGVNSLGESLRQVLSGFGGKQLLLVIWHPSLLSLIDHFHLHRPPMVWPSLGPELCKYYVRTERDALFIDFEGAATAAYVTDTVSKALGKGTPLVCVNVLPEQERDFVSLDIRVKTGK